MTISKLIQSRNEVAKPSTPSFETIVESLIADRSSEKSSLHETGVESPVEWGNSHHQDAEPKMSIELTPIAGETLAAAHLDDDVSEKPRVLDGYVQWVVGLDG